MLAVQILPQILDLDLACGASLLTKHSAEVLSSYKHFETVDTTYAFCVGVLTCEEVFFSGSFCLAYVLYLSVSPTMWGGGLFMCVGFFSISWCV